MITFATQRIEDEWELLHPELRTVLDEFGHWSASERLPLAVVTCILRTNAENHAIYGKDQFSWHLLQKAGFGHAFDLRTKHYTSEQLAKVFAWFNNRCPSVKKWELIVKPHGTGPHIHLGLRRPG